MHTVQQPRQIIAFILVVALLGLFALARLTLRSFGSERALPACQCSDELADGEFCDEASICPSSFSVGHDARFYVTGSQQRPAHEEACPSQFLSRGPPVLRL